ncbi:MAG: hypothetical protein IH623_18365 [Verrucomicrobia bacterium]|nr:hypothetical protein [Verrucomicrobiota bacterium]
MTNKQVNSLAGAMLTVLALTAGLVGSRYLHPAEAPSAAAEASSADKENPTTSLAPASTMPAVEGTSGRRVYIDPATGRPGSIPPTIPPGLSRLPEVANALSTSSEGLREVPVAAPGGGVMVDLQGRFRSLVTATVGADGSVGLRCGPGLDGCGEVDCSTPGDKTSVNNPPVQSSKRDP